MQCVKTRVGGNYSPMCVPSDMHSCLVPDRWTCRDVNEIFFADLEILSADKCLSLFQHWSSNRPIWDWGLQKGGSVVVSMARKKSLWSAELAQSSLSPFTATQQELRTLTLTLTLLLLLTVVINLTIDCHHCSATARCVTCELFAAPSHHTHSSHDSRPRTSWKTIISQEDKLGQTIERNSQLIPSQKDTSSCIINHFTTISVFILYLLIVLCITVDRSCTASKRQEIQNKAWTWENLEYLEEIVFTLVRVEFEMQNRRVLTLPDTMIQTLPHSSRVQG